MSFDPSRTPYTCTHCNTLPCSCTRSNVQLTFESIPCPVDKCTRAFFSKTDMLNHLSEHSKPLKVEILTNQDILEATKQLRERSILEPDKLRNGDSNEDKT